MFASMHQEQSHAHAAMPAANDDARLDSRFAWRVLDEIDYGMLLVTSEGDLLHGNQVARDELSRGCFVRVRHGKVGGACPEQTHELTRGVQSAAKGRRLMLTLRDGQDTLPVASVPLPQALGGDAASVLLIFGRQSRTRNLAVAFYSRLHGLTPAEESVLKGLCDGMDVHEIASAKRVSECTVRTQLRSLRDKTGTTSIRLLVQRVAALPPMIPLTLAMDGELGRLGTA